MRRFLVLGPCALLACSVYPTARDPADRVPTRAAVLLDPIIDAQPEERIASLRRALAERRWNDPLTLTESIASDPRRIWNGDCWEEAAEFLIRILSRLGFHPRRGPVPLGVAGRGDTSRGPFGVSAGIPARP